MISRRGFLKGMLGLAAAPAICKAENLMKIWVPPQELVLGRGMTRSVFHVDESVLLSSRLGGDYDGDTISIQSILPDRFVGHPGDNTIHMRRALERHRAQIKQSHTLRDPIGGRTVVAARYPIMDRGSFRIIKI